MITSCKDYHRHTSYERQRMGGHSLDWPNQPSVYKEYQDLDLVPLPLPGPALEASLSEIVLTNPAEQWSAPVDLEKLSRIFSLSYRLTAKSVHAGGEFYYRSVPSAGALYPCELYVATRAVLGLPDGLYHYAIGPRGLVPLRSGNYLEDLCPASPTGQAEQTPLLMFFVTAIFFRSAWKYRARSYRYHLVDSGHLLESLTLSLNAHSLTCSVRVDFNDQEINSFLSCDPAREACLAVVSVGCGDASATLAAGALADLPDSIRAASRVSSREITYEALQEFHCATTSLITLPGDIPDMTREVGAFPVSWREIPAHQLWPEQMTYDEAVGRRRSHRNFIRAPIPEPALHAFAAMLCGNRVASGSRSLLPQQTVTVGFLVGNVEGIDAGCYWLDPSQHRVGMTRSGLLTARMAHLCLDQEWLAQASLHFFFATNLEVLDNLWGPRGYRYAMLTAGRLGQRIYAAATSFGLGCCGIGAFYDREAAALLGLNEDSAMLYLLGVGPVKRSMR
jgi:SagB-type dehydrogenase family enzyme